MSTVCSRFLLIRRFKAWGGRQILHTLEQDVYFSHAHRVEIPASVTAHLFYQHFGYRPKPGGIYPDDEGLYRLEKFPHESFH
ncbi:GNAT family acetyltransferase [Lactiplantibacillus plantarum]|nr:GNAT family acetyltransferase [Lactiplantibacillus plantarum]